MLIFVGRCHRVEMNDGFVDLVLTMALEGR